MLTRAIWKVCTDWSPEPVDYLLALLMSIFTIIVDVIFLPLELIAFIIWKVKEG